jgi:hypothetical protein
MLAMENIYLEHDLRRIIEPPYTVMLDMWNSLVLQQIGIPIEILVLNRRLHPKFKDYDDILNSAMPSVVGKEIKLIVYLENTSSVDAQVLTHEIGHWVLKLKGFEGIRMYDDSMTSGFILSLSQHRALYELQRSVGIDPQTLIDDRARDHILPFRKDDEPHDRRKNIDQALVLTDILLSCSQQIREEIQDTVFMHYKKTAKWIKLFLETASYYNLLTPADCLKFTRMLIRKADLKADWIVRDDKLGLIKSAKEISVL